MIKLFLVLNNLGKARIEKFFISLLSEYLFFFKKNLFFFKLKKKFK